MLIFHEVFSHRWTELREQLENRWAPFPRSHPKEGLFLWSPKFRDWEVSVLSPLLGPGRDLVEQIWTKFSKNKWSNRLGCFRVLLQKLPPPPVQDFLERRRVGEENYSKLITLRTDPEKGKIKNKWSEEGESQWKVVELSISPSFSHSFFFPLRNKEKVEIQGGGRGISKEGKWRKEKERDFKIMCLIVKY